MPTRYESPTHSQPVNSKHAGPGADRRANPALRLLIDEMMLRLRELNRNAGTWSTTDHARAQAELDVIMARVRRAAVDTTSSG
jgi:hypothetical protein